MPPGLLSLDDCVGREGVGRKAELLARARRAGLRVPDGLVVLPGSEVSDEELRGALGRLGARRYVVRSSAEREDQAGRSAAGLFLSLVGVAPEQVPAAVREVLGSGASEGVRRYLGGPAAVAALIQPQVEARRLGVLQLDRSGAAVCEERGPEEPEWAHVEQRALPEDEALLRGARALAGLLGAGAPAQVEYAVDAAGEIVFLQVRPAPPAPVRDAAGWTTPDREATYLFDRGHNPDPLSRAQQGLVERCDGACEGLGVRQRVVRGYLFYARTGPGPAPIPPAQLAGRFFGEILPACEGLLGPLEAAAPATVPAALSAYVEVFRLYVGLLSPSIRGARDPLDGLLRESLGEGLGRHPALLEGVASATHLRLQAQWDLGRAPAGRRADLLTTYMAAYGAYSPCWDVCVPCDDESPARVLASAAAVAAGPSPEERLRAAAGRHREAASALRARLPRAARGALEALLPHARAAAALAEDDDALFFRAQRSVRRALLGSGAALREAGLLDDPAQVFDLPLQLLTGAAPGGDLRALALQGRRRRSDDRGLVPPERIQAGLPTWALRPGGAVLRGLGVPGGEPAPVRGIARVVRSLDEGPGGLEQQGAVLVLPALLPSWAPQLMTAAALVTDTGGALCHGATLAREAGVPAVLGTGAATRELPDGGEVIVDAVRGLVYVP